MLSTLYLLLFSAPSEVRHIGMGSKNIVSNIGRKRLQIILEWDVSFTYINLGLSKAKDLILK